MNSDDYLTPACPPSPPENAEGTPRQKHPCAAQRDSRLEQAESRTEQAEARTEQAKTRTEQAEMRTERAETRTDHAKTRTEQAEQRTEQAEKRSEEAIRESELRYRRLFEAARDGILTVDAQTGRVTDANPFLVEMLCFPRRELVGTRIWEIAPFREVITNKAMCEQLRERRHVLYEDLLLETKDGRSIAVEFTSNVYEAGDCVVIQCNVRDITKRKQAEIAASRLAAIVECSDDAIIGTDLNSIVTSWNKGAETILGYSPDEMVGTSLARVIPTDRQDEERQMLTKIQRGESVEHFETLRQTKDGRLIPIAVTASPIKDATGRIVGVSRVARDITERKQAEDNIRRLNAELERRVTERTAQLQEANKELQAFNYSVAHDLRAPLRHVAAFAEALQQDVGPSLAKENLVTLTTISEEAKRMGELIDALLDFSRIGHSEMQKTDVDVGELVRQIVSNLQVDAKDRKVTWKIHSLASVRADRALLRIALVNLLSNAMKFTGTRSHAEIEVASVSGAGDETVFFVRDNGVGFDPRNADKLFGVFQRLHGKEEFEGTGIGLANVQRVIHRHGGRTWAEGSVDGGATFYFSIPQESTP